MLHGATENAGHENAAHKCRGVKCNKGKCGGVENARQLSGVGKAAQASMDSQKIHYDRILSQQLLRYCSLLGHMLLQ